MKPKFRPRTFAPTTNPEGLAKARAAWREFYRTHPEEWRKRCDLERRTYENIVQQYVEKYGLRPDNDKLEGWDY